MVYHTYKPCEPLSNFIDYLFFYEGYAAEHAIEKFLPDASMDILIDLTESPKKLYHDETGNHFTSFRKSWISGMKTKFILIDASVSCMMGVHFKPGGAYPFLDFPVHELNDLTIELDTVWNSSVHSLRDQLLNIPDVSARFKVLEEFMFEKGKNKLEPNAFMNYAIARLQDSPAIWTIDKLSKKVGYSQKHLINLFKKHAGLSPKVLSRILKFQYVIEQVERKEALDWTDIAYGCGYYDQAHFIKEFRAFSGINPSGYLSQKGDFLNYIPLRG